MISFTIIIFIVFIIIIIKEAVSMFTKSGAGGGCIAVAVVGLIKINRPWWKSMDSRGGKLLYTVYLVKHNKLLAIGNTHTHFSEILETVFMWIYFRNFNEKYKIDLLNDVFCA